MIEVEKKFVLSEEEIQGLVKGSRFVGEVELDDVYYDTPDFALMKQDRYLRRRNGQFELKVSTALVIDAPTTHYRELTNKGEIREELGLGEGDFEWMVERAGYKPIVSIKTLRKKYKEGDFNIDIDSADFGHEVAEVELMVEKEEDVQGAIGRIKQFAFSKGLWDKSEGEIRGKVMEYLYRKNRAVYEEIAKSWKRLEAAHLRNN